MKKYMSQLASENAPDSNVQIEPRYLRWMLIILGALVFGALMGLRSSIADPWLKAFVTFIAGLIFPSGTCIAQKGKRMLRPLAFLVFVVGAAGFSFFLLLLDAQAATWGRAVFAMLAGAFLVGLSSLGCALSKKG